VGGCTHLLSRFRVDDAVVEFMARPVTFVTAVPSIIRVLMVHEGASHLFGPARTVLFGGSPMPRAWTAELLDRWPHLQLIHGYGLTEFTSAATFLPHELIVEHSESVGWPAPWVSLRVVDEHGIEVPTDTAGEVQVTGPTRMLEYWNQPELTSKKLDGEWLRTGDIGHLDGDGLLWLNGRIDDVINRGGEKVLPADVESCIAQLPEVAEVTVFAIPDAVLQNRVGAAVELRHGGSLDEERAHRRLAERLPDYSLPERWVIYPELPRTSSGKVDRRQVHQDFVNAAAEIPQPAKKGRRK
jgi:acyl-CoA synthetase (AMP-forming)/AMP-acid ligase II